MSILHCVGRNFSYEKKSYQKIRIRREGLPSLFKTHHFSFSVRRYDFASSLKR